MKTLSSLISILCLSSIVMLGACEETEELINCASICEAYEDCANELGQDVDLTQCVDECEDAADQVEGFADDAQACEQCLDENQSCAENFPCADECAGVVPELVF